MIRTNGFALFRGPDSKSRAERAASRVKRFSRETVVEDWPGRGLGGTILAYAMEGGRAPPVVHGYAEAASPGQPQEGEYAILDVDASGLLAIRDSLGTRPLYLDPMGTVASDHRLAAPGANLLPAGSTWRPEGIREWVCPWDADASAGIEEIAEELAELLKASVEGRVAGRRKVAVSFSGGLDSSLLSFLASKRCEVVLCSASVKGSRDEDQAPHSANLLGLEHVRREVDQEAVERELAEIDLPFRPTAMDRALWCLYNMTSRMAREEEAELILLGQLADELFGGYEKYALAARQDEDSARRMMEEDVAECARRSFIRDEVACSKWIEPRFPFADSAVARLALRIPVRYKIAYGERKHVLRIAALALGLPEEIAMAPKKAAQYSSGIAKLVE